MEIEDGKEEVIEGQKPEGEQKDAATDGGDDAKGKQSIPKERFDQVYGKLSAYKEFGTPEEIKAQLAQFNVWKKQVDDLRAKSQGREQAEDPKEKIRKQLLEVMPELGELSSLGELKEHQISSNMEKASSHLSTLLKTEKLEVAPEVQDEIEDFIVNKMSEAQLKKFLKGDTGVVTEVFNACLEKGLLATLKPKAPALPKAPMRHAPGGTPPKAPQKIKTFDEAGDAAWGRLSEGK